MMKTLLLILGSVLVVNLNAQTIPDGGFESWSTTPYSEPSQWWTSITESLRNGGSINSSSVTGFSGLAVRMQTTVTPTDTFPGYIVLGTTMADPISGQGGMPYSQKPTNLTGYYRYNLPGNDTAVMVVLFKKNGTVISSNFFKIRGTGSQPTFASFSYTLSVATATATPDSVIFATASSNAINNIGVQNGSYLELDQLTFTGPGITQQMPNNNFENWTAKSYDKLLAWSTAGEGVSQVTTGVFSGSYAISLTTISYGTGVGGSGVSNGVYTQSGPPKGGRPYTQTLDTLIGYYKYFTSAADTGVAYVSLSQNNIQLIAFQKYLTANSNWTQFKIPISSVTTPDTLRFEAYSSKWPYSASSAGSNLQLDNVYLKSQPVGVNLIRMTETKAIVYPNPAEDFITILFGYENYSAAELSVFNITGQKVFSKHINAGDDHAELNISEFPVGLYYYLLESEGRNEKGKFIKK